MNKKNLVEVTDDICKLSQLLEQYEKPSEEKPKLKPPSSPLFSIFSSPKKMRVKERRRSKAGRFFKYNVESESESGGLSEWEQESDEVRGEG